MREIKGKIKRYSIKFLDLDGPINVNYLNYLVKVCTLYYVGINIGIFLARI